MQNRWSDTDAQRYIERFAAVGEDIALRVYTSHLIGAETSLVLHGGGNTSVKSSFRTILGEEMEAIYVKGSGWNLDSIEPPGFPGLDLAYLRRLRQLESLSDEEMVNQLRTHLFDSSSPNPSVETLLHAFLPYKFVDHSHADAILALTNQPDGMQRIADLFGESVAVLHYVMPGFLLSKEAAAAVESVPNCNGLVLHKHGLFTFGETAREAYERHIELVTMAEEAIAKATGGKRAVSRNSTSELRESAERRAAELAPYLRGALHHADPEGRRWIVEYRCDDLILDAVSSGRMEDLFRSGTLTPDHVIRTKELPLILDLNEIPVPQLPIRLQEFLAEYISAYDAYFAEQSPRHPEGLKKLDPLPRVVLVRDVGMFTVGKSAKDAAIAADIYEHTMDVKTVAPLLGRYEALGQDDLFDMEYWSLEQAKLAKGKEKPLQRQVAVVTGAAGAIGTAICEALAADGATVAALDIDEAGAQRVATACEAIAGKGSALGLRADVTDEASIAAALGAVARRWGGVDVVVLNAGIALSAPIDAIDPERWRTLMAVNLDGYFLTMQAAVRLLKQQGSGGSIIVNSSKNVFAPGKEFAAYSASKAAGHQLGKIAAMELGGQGIRVNMVNADAVFSHGATASGLWQDVGPGRAKAKGITPDKLEAHYQQQNLLRTQVKAEDVARAVLFFARQETPTTGATLPVDGGVPAAFPR